MIDLQRTVYPHKWSPVSYRSSARQGKFAGQRPTFYYCDTQPTLILDGVKIPHKNGQFWGADRPTENNNNNNNNPICKAPECQKTSVAHYEYLLQCIHSVLNTERQPTSMLLIGERHITSSRVKNQPPAMWRFIKINIQLKQTCINNKIYYNIK